MVKYFVRNNDELFIYATKANKSILDLENDKANKMIIEFLKDSNLRKIYCLVSSTTKKGLIFDFETKLGEDKIEIHYEYLNNPKNEDDPEDDPYGGKNIFDFN
jgi:GTP-binding protein EngB required for normal cell division